MRCAGDAFLMESKDFVNNSESFHQRIKVLATIRGKLFWTCVVQISSQDHPTGKITKKYRVRYIVPPRHNKHRRPRQVFLVSISASTYARWVSRYNPFAHTGHVSLAGPLLDGNVNLRDEWMICVMQPDYKESAKFCTALTSATILYLDGGRSLQQSTTGLTEEQVANIAAVQGLGSTTLSNAGILALRNDLVTNWGAVYNLLWSSQHFAVLFGFLILNKTSRKSSRMLLQGLLGQIVEAYWHFFMGRHMFLGVGMVVGGVVIGPAVALLSWGTAGGAMFSMVSKDQQVRQSLRSLRERYPALRSLIVM